MTVELNIFGTVLAEPTHSERLDSEDGRASGATFEAVVAQVKQVVLRAESEHARVRAVGSSWSSTDVFVSDEYLVETHRLAGLLLVTRPEGTIGDDEFHYWLEHPIRDDLLLSTRFAYVGAGSTVNALYRTLDRLELTLPVMGSASGQTIGGAISTGTHGADFNREPIADCVRAVRLVGPGATEYWIEPAGSRRLTDPGTVRAASVEVGLDLVVHQDDDLFDAALTSVGCLGIITAVVIEVVPRFGLSEVSTLAEWGPVRDAIRDRHIDAAHLAAIGGPGPTGSEGLVDLEIFLNPYLYRRAAPVRWDGDVLFDTRETQPPQEEAPSGRDVLLVKRHRRSGAAPPPPPRSQLSLLGQIGLLRDVGNGDYDAAARQVTAVMQSARFDGTRRFHGASFLRDTYDGAGAISPGITAELCIPTTDGRHTALLDDLIRAFDDTNRATHERFTGFFSIRFQRPSAALLAMQHAPAQRTAALICHVEIQALLDLADAALPPLVGHGNTLTQRADRNSGDLQGPNDEYLRQFERVAIRHGARMHWGQLNLLTRQRVESDYADTLYRWRRVRTRLGEHGNSATFSSAFSERVGLESYTEVAALCATGPGRYELFGYRDDGAVVHLQWDGESWQAAPDQAAPEGQRFLGPLASASARDGDVVVVGTGRDHHLLVLERRGGTWTAADLGADGGGETELRLNSPLSVCALGGTSPLTLVFGLDRAGHVRCGQRASASDPWTWEVVAERVAGHRCRGRIAAAAAPNGRIDLFGRRLDGRILHKWRPAGADRWANSDEEVIDFGRQIDQDEIHVFATPLACASAGDAGLDLFALNERQDLVRASYRGGAWRVTVEPWPDRFGTTTALVPFALSRSATGAPSESHYAYPRTDIPNTFFGELTAASQPDEDRVDVMGLGRDSGSGTRRAWYQATFIGDSRPEWHRGVARFWNG